MAFFYYCLLGLLLRPLGKTNKLYLDKGAGRFSQALGIITVKGLETGGTAN